MKKEAVLTAKDLEIGYRRGKKEIPVLQELNFDLRTGQLVCLMGPNGIGKSTLIKTLCKAQKPLAGSIQLAGKSLSDYTIQEFAFSVSVVLTDSINIGNLTVGEVIAFGRYPHTSWIINFTNRDKEAIQKAIKHAGVEDITGRRIFELSDGQRQKVMIARALCQETPVIILDEPTAHLDLNNRVEVINLLKKLSRESDKAILMATHELDLALQAADELWIVGADQKLIKGFPEDLVLNGKIDEVFNLKGFDLKTGYLEKTISKESIHVIGDGHLYLWTKNALERNGFGVDPGAKKKIEIIQSRDKTIWKNEKGAQFDSLKSVIESLL